MKIKQRVLFLLGSLLLLALCSRANLQAQSLPEGTQPVHWRLTWAADPAHQATLSWSTTQSANKFQVRYWEKNAPANGGTIGAERGRFTGGEHVLYYYHARLNQLKPATAYSVQIVSDEHQSAEMYFVTAAADDRPFSIITGGDSRTDHKERRRVNRMIAKLVSTSISNDDPADDIIALAHGGDYVATGTDLAQWSQWLSDHELTTGEDGRLLPLVPTRGNHDKGPIFNQIFGFPEPDKNYYAINLGANVRLITLNTETATAGNQAKWLNRELKTSRPINRWVFAQYHRPAFPAVKAPSSALYSWVPIFEKHNLDLVCEQDGHTIKRTLPIRGNVEDATGVVYIGEGGLGVAQRTPKNNRWYLQPPGMSDSASHVYVLTFETDQLTGRCQRLAGGIADTFALKPRDLTPDEDNTTTNTKTGKSDSLPAKAK